MILQMIRKQVRSRKIRPKIIIGELARHSSRELENPRKDSVAIAVVRAN